MIQGIKNVRVMTPKGIVKTDIHIKDGKIENLIQNSQIEGITFNEDVLVVPGFIDQHIHGANESDAMDSTHEALINIAQSIVKEGTTAFLPTTMTQTFESIVGALKNINEVTLSGVNKGAEILGVHLEGPYINIEASGAQPRQHIVNPTIKEFETFQKASGNNIKMVTLAPEVSGGQELIKYCKKHKIVASIGHTKASYDTVSEAVNNGASSVTHCFNAMTGLHHRDLGVVGATLINNKLDAEIIVDGIHVHEKAVSLLYKNKGKTHVTLVTDAMRAKGLEDGEYDLGGQVVYVKDGQARLIDGTLAGSTLKMIDAIKNSMKFLNISIEDAVTMASTNPAKKLGVFDRKGSIEKGKDADLVILDSNHRVLMTICKGEIVYERGDV